MFTFSTMNIIIFKLILEKGREEGSREGRGGVRETERETEREKHLFVVPHILCTHWLILVCALTGGHT